MTMTVREKLNDGRFGVVVGVTLVVAAAVLIYFMWPSNGVHGNPYKVYYSDDDGQTYFRDSIYKFPPFDHDGKTAVQAILYTDGSHTFVGYLQRYTPEAQKVLQDKYNAAIQNNTPPALVINSMHDPRIAMGGVEVKLPGDTQWAPRGRLNELLAKGPHADAIPVLP